MARVTPPTHHLDASDRPALRRHFLALGHDDRRLRFGSALQDGAILDYIDRIDFERDEVFGVRDDELELLGVVHVAFATGSAELGLSVTQGQRGKGIGGALFERAIVRLRNLGVESVFVHCLAENQAMLHLAKKNGMRVAYEGSETAAHQQLAPATPATLLTEWAFDQHADAVQAVRENKLLARRFFMLFK
ncbi:GNAT family N-acetyltransferase [Usitatibacter palustris]|uniref:N-acetyltransferase domain-containing protein n=1 Tax=Usitatibacter palustris TaxID=2732487 RepID=A0A6M4H8F6_9PROT|nr:GNAT family N-acetyltransferase [Usitatibacter palustris]QJR15445.1 hypothetical protein DSM104440_02266 [Usitatibacter palustris]